MKKNKIPDGWHITYHPKAIPRNDWDWDFYHDNYDGENGLCGAACSPEAALEEIKCIEMDNTRDAEWICPECGQEGDYIEIRKPIDRGVDQCPQCGTEVVTNE